MVIRNRSRREDSVPGIELAGSGAITGSISGSPHPLVAVINQLEINELACVSEGGDKTVETALGHGRATKEDGRLSPELRAAAIPRRLRGLRGSQNNHSNPRRSSSTITEPPIREGTACHRDPVGWQSVLEEMAYMEGRVASPQLCNRPF
ncbi:hypothetical protein NDU88_005210 [Pleurodeles waltl]|uniref:Uncharacterized protein n=1 Tax=Pleurodeles waltl TaxID=8319 RepID=A0AAV7LKU5_PLEWA|nr:hypothetical protein NDU88_005210 [Pleurodeles waltl]